MSWAGRSTQAQREAWKRHPPGKDAPSYAFSTVSHRWVTENPHSRENTMRDVLEAIFNKPFPKARPAFLKNPATNWPLELDSWCAELRIGAEFHGVQHFTFPNPFHRSRAQFEAQRQRDALKVQLCEKYGCRLVVVPHTVARDDIDAFVRNKLQDLIHKDITTAAEPVPAAAALDATAAGTTTDVAAAAGEATPDHGSLTGDEAVMTLRST